MAFCYGSLSRLQQMSPAIRAHIVISTFPDGFFFKYFLLAHLKHTDQFLTTIPWHGELGEGSA